MTPDAAQPQPDEGAPDLSLVVPGLGAIAPGGQVGGAPPEPTLAPSAPLQPPASGAGLAESHLPPAPPPLAGGRPLVVTIHVSLASVLLVGGAAFLVWFLAQVPEILGMVAVAAVLAASLSGIVRRLAEGLCRGSRGLAISVVLGFAGMAVLAIMALLVPPVVGQAQELVAKLPSYVEQLKGTYTWLAELDARTGHFLPKADALAATASQYAAGYLKGTLGLAGAVLGSVTNVAFILMITVMMLGEAPELRQAYLALVPPKHRPVAEGLIAPVVAKLGGYVAGVGACVAFMAAYLGIALSMAGVPLSLALAAFAGLCEIVPMVGSFIGMVPIVLVALTVSWKLALVAFSISLVGNLVQGNILAPMVFSKSVDVSPLVVTLALLAGGSVAGIAGAILAVPVFAALQVMVQQLYIARLEAQHQEEQAVVASAAPATPRF